MQVLQIKPMESVSVDQDRLGALYSQLGAASAEDVVCRALEELALRMSHCESLFREAHWEELRKNTRSLIAIADQIGMRALSNVACDVTTCIDQGNGVAIAATLSRLMRVGDRSLTAVWDIQDITI
ncbi:hypothetical protein [Sulfitobacter geojensis]|jgi:hypothetical protein|uniref:Uncharacterized protein n=1 Tax=Sulfitobacter geojensis TaxID=1342299 RepID=A0AAE3B6B7_9RHOB|nr:hypothetical protein [Sulfitobacter geojensis]KHA50689.1 hypothetical protein Z947_958 [Sulfitobacter geojensis]MBM1689702.1 hypothetical protein [Sulfitobacter geojensis]MBM1693768.1 hypothetical protein [Sulfitobacter geojensis]MBM1705934.1 hypothetical protein [Sulfitobacter geojensis]MBM1709992.1 hypothetical protein [Sulfitobacter geojensis]